MSGRETVGGDAALVIEPGNFDEADLAQSEENQEGAGQ